MRLLFSILTMSLLLSVAFADKASDRLLKRVDAHVTKGKERVDGLSKLKTNAKRLKALDRSLYNLRTARKLAKGSQDEKVVALAKTADSELVRALNGQTEIYYVRKSLPLAKKRNDEALAVNPKDARALKLAKWISDALEHDIYEELRNTVAIQRFKARRRAAGVPLRDRGSRGGR